MMPILKKFTYIQFALYAFMIYWTVLGTVYFVESDECNIGNIGERSSVSIQVDPMQGQEDLEIDILSSIKAPELNFDLEEIGK